VYKEGTGKRGGIRENNDNNGEGKTIGVKTKDRLEKEEESYNKIKKLARGGGLVVSCASVGRGGGGFHEYRWPQRLEETR